MKSNDNNDLPKKFGDAPENLDGKKSDGAHELNQREQLDKNIESHLSHLKEATDSNTDQIDVANVLQDYLGRPNKEKGNSGAENGQPRHPFGDYSMEYPDPLKGKYADVGFFEPKTPLALLSSLGAAGKATGRVLLNGLGDAGRLLVHPLDEINHTKHSWEHGYDPLSSTDNIV